MQALSAVTTFLFTDIEGSSRLWEEQPERMRPALAHHDALVRAAVESHHGTVVKMIGDGIHAAFDEPLDALNAALAIQRALVDGNATLEVALRVRCGLHLGVVERRDNDYFGGPVNRAARIMSAAHGGQVLLSQAVVDSVRERLPSAVSLRDLGGVRLKDLATPEHVYQLVHPQLRQEFPALRSLEATPNNLPQQISSFIGRERELAEVKRLLAQSRLLTLVGIGGIGKTRLSLQVAADALDAYPDGVWVVELGSITNPLLVPSSVAQVLGVQEHGGTPLTHTLCSHLRSCRLLLVLDNCEHLITAGAELAAALLAAAPEIRILATSREPLHLTGEQTYPLLTLSLAAPDAGLDSLVRAEAVQLFAERARLQQPGFVLTERQAPAIGTLCAHLDGLPLALELAAARMRSLSVEEINAGLNDRFKLLTGGTRTALPRQKTLRATFDWSYGLLAEQERTVLRGLAIFAGGFTLEAASSVVSDETIDDSEVVDLLSQLVARSLVVADTNVVRTRYRLLETTRAYALEKLTEAGKIDTTQRRHALAVLATFERSHQERWTVSMQALLESYLPDLDNLRVALDWAAGPHGDSDVLVALAGAACWMWARGGLQVEGLRRCEQVIARFGTATVPMLKARLYLDYADMSIGRSRAAEKAQAAALHAMELYRELGDRQGLYLALVRQAMVHARTGDVAAAEVALGEATRLYDAGWPLALRQPMLSARANILIANDRLPESRGAWEESLHLGREIGDTGLMAYSLSNLVDAVLALGDIGEAIARGRELVAMVKRGRFSGIESFALGNLCAAYTAAGQLDEALNAARESIPLLRQQGAIEGFLDHFAMLAFRRGRVDAAARALGCAETVNKRLGYRRGHNEQRARDVLMQSLQKELAAAELDRLLQDGAGLTDEAAAALALAD